MEHGVRKPNLSQVRQKIEWAKKHVCEVRRLERAFLEGPNCYSITREFEPDRQGTAYRFRDRPVPPEIPLACGDAVHNLRSALDFLACELVRSATGGECGQVYFPIFKDEARFKAKIEGKIKGFSDQQKNILRSIKPYQGAGPSVGAQLGDWLWALHRLDINDKHRILVTAAGRVGAMYSPNGIESGPRSAIGSHVVLEDGCELGFVSGRPEDHQHPEFRFNVAFGRDEPMFLRGRPVVFALNVFCRVAEEVVGLFL